MTESPASSSCCEDRSPTETPMYKSPYSSDGSELAIARFMSEFTLDSHDLSVSPGFLHNLPQLYRESSDTDALLVQAVKAVSLVNLSNHTRSTEMAFDAKKAYGSAIALLNKRLSAGAFQSDSTLTAVLFLNYYQVRALPISRIAALI